MPIAMILIDSREPDWVKALTFGGIPKSIETLKFGDAAAMCVDGELVLMERKAAGDLLNSIKDGRLTGQCAGIRSGSDWCYLVITGGLVPGRDGKTIAEGRESGWDWASVQGALLTVQELGVNIIHVPSDANYEAAVLRLGNRSHDVVKVAPVRESEPLSVAETVLTSLPGIGPDKAAAILQHTAGNAAWALHLLTDLSTPCTVPGVGPSTRAGVRKVLGLDAGNVLAVVTEGAA